jgi:hypothetical protein
MKLTTEARRRLLVAACFAGFIAMSLLVAYLLGFLPSFEEKCAAQCKPLGLKGHMVRVFPASMTGAREGPKECKCFSSSAPETQ